MPYSLRSRTHSPLAELPLDRYVPAKRASTSPTPRGSKRHQPYASTSTSTSTSTVASSSKDRLGEGEGEDGEWTKSPIKKRTRTVTPRVKQVLDRDDLGVGKSPARRLFTASIAESSSSHSSLGGISGAVLTPPFNTEIRATQTQTETETPIQNKTLIQYEDGNGNKKEDIHDPGFIIHPDLEGLVVGGRPHTRSHSRSTSPCPFVSSSLSELGVLDNQENIAPPLFSSTSSTCSTASIPRTPHSQRSAGSTSSHCVDSFYLSPSTVPSSSSSHSHHWSPYSTNTSHSHGHTPGSSRRRREQSKLVNELLLLRGEDVPAGTSISTSTKTRIQMESRSRSKREKEVIVPDELTPGRRTTRGMVRRGRDLLAKEVDSV
ncbi:hypothetical protein CNBG_5718 [Cryptococcus deuterogattii R265]|uniref:Uncharacterized protein n=1 Tax=Cryptococcus deuterogattii (strain R265) TaxID=294750 RepID=A0A095CHN2_CRYD2|nr:hypothetical protein CNBG_5718 [Cryptococcus deuterogattii R265]KIR72532.1 hypothetical protein I310_03942 [Cryptococcus deuterogattii CA1014]